MILILEMGGLLLLTGIIMGLITCAALNILLWVPPGIRTNYPDFEIWGPMQFATVGIVIASIVWMLASLAGYYQGDNILLTQSKAKKIGPADHHRLYNIVEELKISSGLEIMPAIYIIHDPAPTAFAIGRDPKKAAIIVTSGLLTKLNRDELQGVIAHEIAHIKNRDVLLMGMCSVMLGATITLTEFSKSLSWSETIITSRSEEEKKYSDRTYMISTFCTIWLLWAFVMIAPLGVMHALNPFTFFLAIFCAAIFFTPLTMTVMIGLPFSVLLIYYALSRRREYLGDATSVIYTRYPEGLASALEKIAASTDHLVSATAATAPIYVANPFGKHGATSRILTSTHPPISERIRILRSMSRISYADYDRAYREVRGLDKSVIPPSVMSLAGTESIRPAFDDDLGRVQRARETSNLLWNLNNYKLIICACGTRMRLPPSFKLTEVKCPHCGNVLPVVT